MILEIFSYLLRFLAILLIQLLVVDNIELSSFINPYIYVSFILMLPITLAPWLVVVLSFLTGGVMDSFASTPGLHMAATTFMGFMRFHYLRATTTKEDMESRITPSLSRKGIVWFVVYCFVLTFIHHLLLFFLEIYGFREFFSTLMRVVLSSMVTVMLIVIGQLLFYRNKLNG
jgi:hypothetical protein